MQTTYLDFEKPLEELDKRSLALSQMENRSAKEQVLLDKLQHDVRQCEKKIFGRTVRACEVPRHPGGRSRSPAWQDGGSEST